MGPNCVSGVKPPKSSVRLDEREWRVLGCVLAAAPAGIRRCFLAAFRGLQSKHERPGLQAVKPVRLSLPSCQTCWRF